MSYKAGIIAAITELNDRSGSSMIAIKKAMQDKLPKEKKWMNSTFLSTLKKGVADGEFVQVKNSYKLSAEFKKSLVKKAAPKKAAPKKAVTKKPAAPKKTEDAAEKSTTKKVGLKHHLHQHGILEFN
jgi:histone H1/5